MWKIKQLVFMLVLVFMLLAIPFLSSCDQGTSTQLTKPITIRFTCTNPPTDQLIKLMDELKTSIPSATNNMVKFEVYPAGQLFSKVDGLKAVKTGEVEMAIGATDLSVLYPGWGAIMGLPFIFDNEDHILRFFQTDAYKEFQTGIETDGFKQIAYMGNPGPAQVFNKARQIKTLEDCKGIKIWSAPMNLMIKSLNALGFQTVSMPATELPQALQTGMVQGAVFPASAAIAFGFDKTCPFLTDFPVGQSNSAFVGNTKWWNGLPSDLRQKLGKIFTDFGTKAQQMHKDQLSKVIDTYSKAPGAIVTTLTKQEKDKWRAAVKPVWDEASQDPTIKKLIEAADKSR